MCLCVSHVSLYLSAVGTALSIVLYCIVCGMNDLVLQNADEGTSIKLVTC